MDNHLPSHLTHSFFTSEGSSNANHQACFRKIPVPAALQLSAIAPGLAGKGAPQTPSVRRASELPAFVPPEGTFSVPGSQMVTEKHPEYHRAADHQNVIFQCLGFLIICVIISHTCLPPGTFLPLSVPGGWWPCCWQPLEDAPRDLGGGSSRSG